MTRMSGPLKVKQPYTDTTVASIDVSGSAKFLGGISTQGDQVAFGRMKVGSSAGDVGDVVLVRQVAIPNSATKVAITLPDGSDILDVKAFIQSPLATSALAQVDLLVGVTADDDRFLRVINGSAQGYYTVPTSSRVSGWNSVSGASAIITVHTTAISGARASGASGRVNIMYVKRQ